MTATKPPVMAELQSWKNYEEIILKWLRITTIPHEKIVGSLLAVGLYKHAVIYKLAENIADEFDFVDIIEPEDLPDNWLKEGEVWDTFRNTYMPGSRDFDRVKYDIELKSL